MLSKVEFLAMNSQNHAICSKRAAASFTIRKPPAPNSPSGPQSGSHCDEETAAVRWLFLLLLAAGPRGAYYNLHHRHHYQTPCILTPMKLVGGQ